MGGWGLWALGGLDEGLWDAEGWDQGLGCGAFWCWVEMQGLLGDSGVRGAGGHQTVPSSGVQLVSPSL